MCNDDDDNKLGLQSRDPYNEKYKSTMRTLSKYGIKGICYNFMPIFDWTRSDLAMPLEDGSNALAYERDKIEGIDPNELIKNNLEGSKGHAMPGWETERLAGIKK